MSSDERKADLVVVNANVITMNHKLPRASAFAVLDGRFVAVAGADEAASSALAAKWVGPLTKVIDLKAKEGAVVPGFVESHTHFCNDANNFFWFSVEVKRCPTYASVLQRIKEIAGEIRAEKESGRSDLFQEGKEHWVRCYGFDETLMPNNEILNRDDLDAASPDLPVWVWHPSLHRAFFNSKAMQLAGLNDSVVDPPGGHYSRYEDGRLNGQADEMPAFSPVYTALMASAKHDHIKQMWGTARRYAAKGITTAHDLWVGPLLLNNYTAAFAAHDEAKGELFPIRLSLYAPANWPARDITPFPKASSDFLRWGGYKIIMDGSIQCYTACCRQPYYDNPHVPHGDLAPSYFSADGVKQRMIELHRDGHQLAVHCNGDGAIEYVLSIIEEALRLFPRPNHRHRLEHCQTPTPDQLERISKAKIVVSFFVGHVYYWGDRHRDRFLGPERAARISPLQSASRLFIPFGLHSDSPVTPVDPLHNMYVATCRETSSGEVLGPEERVSAEMALRAFTIDAAFLGSEETIKGSIEVGKLADFVFLSQDILAIEPREIQNTQVISTFVHGRQVFGSHDPASL
eukprot:TRINITY_DN3648_c0_g1_i1.p1 TRINITY_DN3648_c0_g1~~TRINITY_DN3648_c0_g1_i1.p1  ORF type:complete len:605 (-),score=188.44 TRINITY_DN3648_c0_g1_i1:353-2071(-)